MQEHDEFDVEITRILPYGSIVTISEVQKEGFIDQTKHPAWWDASLLPPAVGDSLHVVVLDQTRTPPRLSALQNDIVISRRLRQEEAVERVEVKLCDTLHKGHDLSK